MNTIIELINYKADMYIIQIAFFVLYVSFIFSLPVAGIFLMTRFRDNPYISILLQLFIIPSGKMYLKKEVAPLKIRIFRWAFFSIILFFLGFYPLFVPLIFDLKFYLSPSYLPVIIPN